MRERTLMNARGLGLLLLTVLCVYSFGTSFLFAGDGNSQNLNHILSIPNAEFLLGTDHFGRNMWLRLADALQLSLFLALACVLTSVVTGVILGVLAATRGGWIDRLIDMLVTLIMALPGLVLVMIFASIAPGSLLVLYIAIALIQWVEYFRLTRAVIQRVDTSPAVESSRLMGFGLWYLFRRHYWPVLAPQLLTLAAFGAANAVLMMASLGFVYVGIQPPTAELGQMIVELFPYYQEAPWLLAQPLLALALLVLAFHLCGRRGADAPD